MPKLPKFTLEYDEKRDRWSLENDRTNREVKSFATKRDAVSGGALRRAVGSEGESVKIQKANGRFQEERPIPARAIRAEARDRTLRTANRMCRGYRAPLSGLTSRGECRAVHHSGSAANTSGPGPAGTGDL